VYSVLQYDDTNVRMQATTVFGKMVASPGSTVTETYPSLWKTWMDRYELTHLFFSFVFCDWFLC
jgi:hypothetical protein